MQGLIFVVDSNDKERIDEAREELSKMVGSQLKWHLVGVANSIRLGISGLCAPNLMVNSDIIKNNNVFFIS